MDEDISRRPQVPWSLTDRSSQYASEPTTSEAVGYELRYSFLAVQLVQARNDYDCIGTRVKKTNGFKNKNLVLWYFYGF